MSKEKEMKKEIERGEFAEELTPDDLDIREDNDLTIEQFNNTNDVKQHNTKQNN